MKAILIVLIAVLIFLFCPIFLLAAGAVLLGGLFLLVLAVFAVTGLIMLLSKAAGDPALARKYGLGGLVAFLAVGVVQRVPGVLTTLAQAGPAGSLVLNTVATLAGCFAVCMLLVYTRAGYVYAVNRSGTNSRSFYGYLCIVFGVVLDVMAVYMTLRYGGWFTGFRIGVILAGAVLYLAGLLLVVRQRPVKAKETPPALLAAPEERQALSLFALGLVIRIVLGAVGQVFPLGMVPGLSVILGYLTYIPLILAAVALVRMLLARPTPVGAAGKS